MTFDTFPKIQVVREYNSVKSTFRVSSVHDKYIIFPEKRGIYDGNYIIGDQPKGKKVLRK